MGPDTGLVFVLLPGGSFWMGAVKTDAENPAAGTRAGLEHRHPAPCSIWRYRAE